jgi:carbamoyltransferase
MHDAAAALMIDGELIACVEEERLSGRKHALSERPVLSARAVLQQAGIDFEDVDVVGFGWQLPNYLASLGMNFEFSQDKDFLASTLQISPNRCPKLCWIGHHCAHAAAAFFSSGLSEAAILVVDGQGEDRSITLFSADCGEIRFVRDWLPSCSLGFLYEAATRHCGFGYLDAGKTMGLATYGAQPVDSLPIEWTHDDIRSPIPDNLKEEGVVKAWEDLLERRFGPAVQTGVPPGSPTPSGLLQFEAFAQHRPEAAAAAQDAVERVLCGLVDYAQKVTGHKDVVLAGGVALNCVANGRIADRCRTLFVPPTAHDAGAAVGAAMMVSHDGGDRPTSVQRVDLGLEYAPDEIAAAASQSGFQTYRVEDPALEAARRIAGGDVIGWFQGRCEVGPRALGYRSILALPLPLENKDRVNHIKGRERWRPLAPSALISEMPWMFGKHIDSPYMLRSVQLSDTALKRIPAVAHVDGSARVQTVPKNQSPFSRLLQELGTTTGTNVVLNTSFNAPGKPIVCTPLDAIQTFNQLPLDLLVIGDFVLEKPR